MPDAASLPDVLPVPRGRHAPPGEVRVVVQRQRLFAVAGSVFARVGYADAGTEMVSRHLGTGRPTDIRDVAPTLERVAHGVLHQAARR